MGPGWERARKVVRNVGRALSWGRREPNVFVLLAALALGAVGASVLLTAQPSVPFQDVRTVDELLAAPDRYRGREVRVQGQLEPGGLRFSRSPGCRIDATIQWAGERMRVVMWRCVAPDAAVLATTPIRVVVQGQLTTKNIFVADELIAESGSARTLRWEDLGPPTAGGEATAPLADAPPTTPR